MYETFYGLREKPFNLTPDPRFLYLSEMHKEAFAHLIFGIRNRVGFIMVTGEIGTGKTTICRSLLGQLDQDVELAFIFNPCLSPEELLRKINEDFGIRSRAISVKGLIDELNTYLLDRHSKSKNCVLVIDEAQNLTPPVLEQIRLLSNLETERQKLLQIVLIGQPELAEQLELPELRQLNQRITARYHLKPLGEKETMQYIAYRLRIAGGMRKVHFSRSAIKSVFRYSKGTPRVINAICDRALLIGYAKETRDISRGIVKQAAREIRGERVRAKKRWGFLGRYVPTPRLVAAAVLIVLVGLFIVFPLTDRLDVLVAFLNRPSPTPQAPVMDPPPKAPEPPPTNADTAKSDSVAAEIPERVPEQSGESSEAPTELQDSDTSDGSEKAEESRESEKVASEPEPASEPERETQSEPEAELEPEPQAGSEPEPDAAPESEKVVAQAEEPELAPTGPASEKTAEPKAPVAEPVAEETPKQKRGVFDAIALVASVVPERTTVSASESAEEPGTEAEADQESEPEEPGPPETAPVDAASEPPDENTDAVEVAKAEETAPEQPIAPQKPVEVDNFDEVLRKLDPADAVKTAASSLLRAWNMALLSEVPAGQRVAHLTEFASAYGFTAEPLSPSLVELEALNLPAFVRVRAGEKLLWLAVVGMDAKHVRCSTGNGTVAIVPRDAFAKVYLAEAVVPWRDPAPEAEVLKPDMEGDHVRALQHRLRQLGFYEGELTGVYDAATAQAVTRIQSETALKKDAKAGQQVRMVLCSWLDDFPTPGLHENGRLGPAQTAGTTEIPVTPPVTKEPPATAPDAATVSPPSSHAEETATASEPEPQADTAPDTPDETNAALESPPQTAPDAQPETEEVADVKETPPAPEETPGMDAPDMADGMDLQNSPKGPEASTPLVTVVELPEGVGPPPSPPSRDVEALLTEEVSEQNTQNTRKEVTAPLYTGVPLVPHRADTAEEASGEDG